jgi:hypothetical protein
MKRTAVVGYAVLALGALVAVGSAPSQAQIKKNGSKYQLRAKWVKGSKLSYNLSMQQAGSKSATMTGLDYSVTGVKGTTGTVEITVRQGGAEPQKETVSIDDRGRVTGSSTVAGFSNILEFPAEAIAVGGTWTTKASMPGVAGGTMNGTSKNTFKGLRTLDGKQYAHVFSELKTTGGGLEGAGKTDTLISTTDGQVFRMTMNMKMSLSTKDSKGKSQTQSIDVVIKMTRK